MKSFISLDVECTSLRAGFKIYAIAMIVYREGVETARFCGARKVTAEDLSFAKGDYWETDMKASHSVQNAKQFPNENALFAEAGAFWKKQASLTDNGELSKTEWGEINYNETPALYHCGMVAEGEFFRKLKKLEIIGSGDAPYCPIEVADFLRIKGENPHKVDAYITKNGLPRSTEGETHNPLFDAEQAATAFFHLISK